MQPAGHHLAELNIGRLLAPTGDPRVAEFMAALDRARVATGLDCRIEGYPPPPSSNLARFAVTPDPGVLEVNLPPTDSCRASAALVDTVFDAALRTEPEALAWLTATWLAPALASASAAAVTTP